MRARSGFRASNAPRIGIACVVLFCALLSSVRAGGLPEHYHLTFTMARAAGYSPDDAHVIASAAWAIDMNRDTTVTDVGVEGFIGHLTNNYGNFGRNPEQFVTDEIFADNGTLKYVAMGVMCHGMGSAVAQKAVGEYWRSQVASLDGRDSAADREARLVLIGMHMHTLVDNHVHPPTPTLGHFVVQGEVIMNQPDRAINRPEDFVAAAREMFDYLREASGRDLSNSDHREHFRRMGLWDEVANNIDRSKVGRFTERAVYAIAAAYQDEYGDRFSEWPYTARPQDWSELDTKALAAKVHASLHRAMQPDFDHVGGLGMSGKRTEYISFQYVRNAQNGSLEIRSANGRSTLITIEDPVKVVRDAPAESGLGAARGAMVADALQYTNNVAWLAVGTVVLPFQRAASSLKDAAVRDLSPDETQKALARARAAAGNLASDAQVVYRWSRKWGLEAASHVASEGPRLMEAGTEGLKLYAELTNPGGGKVYEIGRDAAMRIVNGAGVGGVNFDAAGDVLRALAAQDSEVERQVVLTEGRVVLVSLKNLHRAFQGAGGKWDRIGQELKQPGSISRIHGYLYLSDFDDVVLIGIRRPGRPVMQLEDLVVALESTWKLGATPKCSLDPQPGRETGPQYSRVDGVPADSRYAKVMLDADYTMKRILFGDLPSGAQGFRSEQNLFNENPERYLRASRVTRFWFFPIQASKDQILVSPTRDAALFHTDLEVLTEAELTVERGVSGVAEENDVNEEVARSFTEHYNQIAQSHPIFDELRMAYDLTVVARLLHEINLKSRSLDDLASIKPPKHSVPPSYVGLRRELGSVPRGNGIVTVIQIAGGADLIQRLARRKFTSRDDLQLVRLRTQARELSEGADFARETDEESLVVTPMSFRMGRLEDRYRQGLRAFGNGNIPSAEKHFTALLAEEPDFLEALAYRALCNVELGRLDAAETDVESALREDPRDDFARRIASYVRFRKFMKRMEDPRVRREFAEAVKRRADRKKELDLYAAAEDDLDLAIQIDPTYAEAYYERAFSWQRKRRYREALDDWNQVVANAPQWSDAYAYRGLTRSNLDEPELDGAVRDCDRALEINPDNDFAFFVRGKAKYDLEDRVGALRDLNESIKRNPGYAIAYYVRARVKMDDPPGWADDMATYFSMQDKASESALLEGEADVMKIMCDTVLARSPQNVKARVLRGMAMAEKGSPEAADRDFGEALRFEPMNVDLYGRRAEVRRAMKDFRGAEADFERMLTLDKQRTDVLLRRADMRYQWAWSFPPGETAKAEAMLKTALADIDRFLDVQPSSFDAYWVRSQINQSLGRMEASLEDMNHCIRFQTSNASAFARRGMMLRQLERYDLAIQDFERAVRIDPSRSIMLKPLIAEMKSKVKSAGPK